MRSEFYRATTSCLLPSYFIERLEWRPHDPLEEYLQFSVGLGLASIHESSYQSCTYTDGEKAGLKQNAAMGGDFYYQVYTCTRD